MRIQLCRIQSITTSNASSAMEERLNAITQWGPLGNGCCDEWKECQNSYRPHKEEFVGFAPFSLTDSIACNKDN